MIRVWVYGCYTRDGSSFSIDLVRRGLVQEEDWDLLLWCTRVQSKVVRGRGLVSAC